MYDETVDFIDRYELSLSKYRKAKIESIRKEYEPEPQPQPQPTNFNFFDRF